MKKIEQYLSIILGCVVLFSSCDSDEYKIPEIVSDKYTIETEQYNGSQTLALHVKAFNKAGGVNLSIENESRTPQEIFVKNEELENLLKLYFTLQPELINGIKKLNYIDFKSDLNLVVSYNDDSGNEILIPDMLKEDGSLTKGLKYRKTFTNLYLSLTERFSQFLSIPIVGELPKNCSFTHVTNEKGFLVIAPKATIEFYLNMLPNFGLDETMISLIKNIVNQYNTTDDTLEIGIYLKNL